MNHEWLADWQAQEMVRHSVGKGKEVGKFRTFWEGRLIAGQRYPENNAKSDLSLKALKKNMSRRLKFREIEMYTSVSDTEMKIGMEDIY